MLSYQDWNLITEATSPIMSALEKLKIGYDNDQISNNLDVNEIGKILKLRQSELNALIKQNVFVQNPTGWSLNQNRYNNLLNRMLYLQNQTKNMTLGQWKAINFGNRMAPEENKNSLHDLIQPPMIGRYAESDEYNIHPRYGCPKEDISCPSCGKIYNGKVCAHCEECSKCCQCGSNQKLMNANAVKEYIAKTGEFPKS